MKDGIELDDLQKIETYKYSDIIKIYPDNGNLKRRGLKGIHLKDRIQTN